MSAINNNTPGSKIKRGPRLLLQQPGGNLTEWLLQPGANSVGRAAENQIQIDHPSVSSAHCSITVNGNALSVRDHGSTNGTFVDGVPIAEGLLQDGQTLQVGQVEMTVRFDAWPTSSAAAADPDWNSSPRQPAPAPKPVEPEFVGAQTCKFHPKMAARYRCAQCGEFFCDACVALRQGGRPFCRHCGVACAPVLARLGEAVEKGFLARLPGAFAYPMRGAGVVVVIVGIVLFGLLKAGEACLHFRNLRILIFGIIVEVFAGGYLFAFLQNIIHATAAEERELPDLPGISNFLEDVIVPFFRLLALLLLSFAPVIGLALWAGKDAEGAAGLITWTALLAGCLYFPMAFLAVAIHDSIAAANPLVVVPSLFKVPLPYLLCLLFLALVAGLQYGGGVWLDRTFPDGMTTGSMGQLFGMIGLLALLSFVCLYLLIVAVHLLGVVFVTRKHALGWLRPQPGEGK